jgi:catechol 2,3-dioxygenase
VTYRPAFHDIAHLGHVELLTPSLADSAWFFKDVIGLHQTTRTAESIYLRGWGDYEACTLKLTASSRPGLGHVAFRTRSEEALTELVAAVGGRGNKGSWVEDEPSHGRAFRFEAPDGHPVELYFDTRRFAAPPGTPRAFKNQPQQYVAHGVAARRLDHINLLASDVRRERLFYQDALGLRTTEQIVFDDGTEMGGWLTATNKSYDLAITRDSAGARGRLHHFTFRVDEREDVLRAADILVENGVTIETGPHKHAIGQTFFLYCFEPGGNRFELAAGGYLILDPSWRPVIWTQADRAKGQAWGLQTVPSFHTYGTPPIEPTS